MNTGIIAEYNPFHNGHEYHIQKTRELTGCENITAVMSGNFVQRGEPAVFDKFVRTRQALLNGVDMVLELPVEYASGAADVFAGAAVEILHKSGIVDVLCFGSEAGSAETLEEVSAVFADETQEFKNHLAGFLSEGMSYPAAREAAAAKILNKDISFINMPNNILALEYITALKRLDSNIKPYSIKREQNGYNDTELSGELSSAAAIRRALSEGNIPKEAVPENTLSDYNAPYFPNIDGYSDIFGYILRTAPTDKLAEIADMTEGLENRFLKYAHLGSISSITDKVKTKRYTRTKLQRAALHCILGITKAMQQRPPSYIRVLGIKKTKMHLLSELTQKSSLPVVTRVKENEALLQTEIRAADIYGLLTNRAVGREYTEKMLITE